MRLTAGGAGMVVTETASVHPDDWPYERAPLAADCGPGWSAVVGACRPCGSPVLPGLGHTGGRPAAPDAGRLRLIRDHRDVAAALTAVSTD